MVPDGARADAPRSRLRSLLTRERVVSTAADLLGGSLLVLGLWQVLAKVHMFRLGYDEGILLSNAHFLMRGLFPYRDFYTNYPPGAFVALAALWSVVGVSELSFRWLGFVLRALIALAAGRLGGQLVGRRFSWLPAGAVACWLSLLNILPAAWLWAVLFALLFVSLFLQARMSGTRRAYVACGAALGALGCCRHDLFGFVVLPLLLYLALPAGWLRRVGLDRPSWSQLGEIGLGAAVPLAVIWIPTLLASGPALILRDLVIDQARYVAPARDLPMPPVWVTSYSSLGAHLPVFLLRAFEGSVVLTLLGPALALLLVACRWWAGLRSSNGPFLLLVLALGVMPQMLGRTDLHHSAATIAPAIVALAACAEALARRAWAGVVALPIAAIALVNPLVGHIWPPPAELRSAGHPSLAPGSDRARGLFERRPEWAGARQRLFPWLAANTGRDEAIYFGARGHSRVHINEVDLYFLADRKPGTRYTQFDPNLVTRGAVQREMIQQLEKNCVRTIVLSFPLALNEPTDWVDPSTALDDYIAANYQQVESFPPPYTVHRRNASSPRKGCPQP